MLATGNMFSGQLEFDSDAHSLLDTTCPRSISQSFLKTFLLILCSSSTIPYLLQAMWLKSINFGARQQSSDFGSRSVPYLSLRILTIDRSLKNHGADDLAEGMFQMAAETMLLPMEEKLLFEQGDAGNSFGSVALKLSLTTATQQLPGTKPRALMLSTQRVSRTQSNSSISQRTMPWLGRSKLAAHIRLR